jgi:hypothetical protein
MDFSLNHSQLQEVLYKIWAGAYSAEEELDVFDQEKLETLKYRSFFSSRRFSEFLWIIEAIVRRGCLWAGSIGGRVRNYRGGLFHSLVNNGDEGEVPETSRGRGGRLWRRTSLI